MKKKILLLSILLLTGCTGKVTYEFKENEILSNVEIQFTIAEYKEYQQQNGIEYTNDIFNPVKNDNLVRDTYNSSAIIATQKNDLYNYYTNKNFKKSNNYYIFEYE